MFSSTGTLHAPPLTGRCYCAKTTLSAVITPQVVSYCHCSDCRRLTGAPVAAFAAFGAGALDIHPSPRQAAEVTPGVTRWFCDGCGAALAATYDYLPDQVYVPVGLFDQAGDLPAQVHSHANNTLPWLNIADDLPRHDGSGRDALMDMKHD